MPIEGEYEPSTWGWVADQVERYEASGGTEANTLMGTGIPIIVMTTVGHKSGKVRKVPLMRVEHEGEYGIIASKGGNPTHPGWYYNLLVDSVKLTLHTTALWSRMYPQYPGHGFWGHFD